MRLKKFVREFSVLRNVIWRLGRMLYTYARGDGQGDPHVNGEYWLLEQALKNASAPQVLLDIGANKGDWTAHALKVTRALQGSHVHAFEPAMATRAMLTARFSETIAVTIHPYALSASTGDVAFYSSEIGAGTNSLASNSGVHPETVKLTTVDNFILQNGLASVLMMKVDTEGFDLLVLNGAENALRKGLFEVVQFEYNWRWLINHASLRDVFDFIADKPYILGKLVGETIEFYATWHFELDRYFENNYVLVRRGSSFLGLGKEMRFDGSNVVTIRRPNHDLP